MNAPIEDPTPAVEDVPVATAIEPVPTDPPVATAPIEPEPSVDEPPDPESLKAEIEELRQKRDKAEQDAIHWRKQKAESRADFFRDRERGAPPPATPTGPPAGLGAAPQSEDFDDYNQYVEAVTDYKVKAARLEWERDQRDQATKGVQAERQASLKEKLQKGFEKYEDFEEVALDRSAIHITPLIADILADCEHPEDVAYYLAKNRVEGVKISRMTPIKAVRAIANLERDLATQTPTVKPKTTVPGAPKPIKPVGSGEKVSKRLEDMSQREYNDEMERRGARRF